MRNIFLMLLLSAFSLQFYAQNFNEENTFISDTVPSYVSNSLSQEEMKVVQNIVRNFKCADYSTLVSFSIHPN